MTDGSVTAAWHQRGARMTYDRRVTRERRRSGINVSGVGVWHSEKLASKIK